MAETNDASRTTKRLRSDFIFKNAQNVVPLSSCLSPFSLRAKGKKEGRPIGKGGIHGGGVIDIHGSKDKVHATVNLSQPSGAFSIRSPLPRLGIGQPVTGMFLRGVGWIGLIAGLLPTNSKLWLTSPTSQLKTSPILRSITPLEDSQFTPSTQEEAPIE